MEASGFRAHRQEIDLRSTQLPKLIILQRIAPPTPSPTLFPPAAEGETLVVVADFLDQLGNDPDRFTQNLVDEIRTTLADYADIRIERLLRAIPSERGSEIAMQIGEGTDINASIVIWGDYVGTDREPQAHLHFEIVKPVSQYLNHNFTEGYGPVQIAEQPSMFDFTVSIGTQLGQVTAFIAGVTLFNAGEHLAAEPLFTTAIPVADQPLAVDFARVLRYYRGTNFLNLGRLGDAKSDLDVLKPGLELTSGTTDDLDLPILNNIGRVYAALGEHQNALMYYEQVLGLINEHDNKVGEAIIRNNIGYTYATLGEKQQALDYYTQALTIHETINDKDGEAITRNNIGNILDEQGDKQQALEYYTHSLSLFQSVNNKAGEAAALNNIGSIYSDLGDANQALEHYSKAQPLFEAIGYLPGEAATFNNIGHAFAAIGEQQKALDNYEQALSLMSQIPDIAGQASTRINIGVVYYTLDDKEKAVEYFEQARLLLQRVNYKDGEVMLLNNIGAINAELGEQQQALENYTEALEILQGLDDDWNQVMVLDNIGNLHRQEGDLDAAAESLETAIALATELNHPDLPDLQALLAQVNAQRGE